MATTKRAMLLDRAARPRALAREFSAHNTVNTAPRRIALAVATAFMPWFVPLTGDVHAEPPPNTVPTLTLTGGSGKVHDPQGAFLQTDVYSARATFSGTIQLGSNAHWNISQPGPGAVTYFKDTSGVTSEIWGRITANGQLFFGNSAGFLFARTATINVGSLVATTLSLNETEFLDPKKNAFSLVNSGASGQIINQGQIVTTNGYTALIGPQVRNDGVIIARTGSVSLVAADRVSLDLIGDGLISISVDQAALNASVINT